MAASGKLGRDQARIAVDALLAPAEAGQRRERAAIEKRLDTSKPRGRATGFLPFVAALVGVKLG